MAFNRDGMLTKAHEVTTKVNGYFFDVEDAPQTDWTSLCLFYGVIFVGLACGVVFTALTFIAS